MLPPSLEMGLSLTGSTTVRPLGLVPETPSCTWNFTISANSTVVVSTPCTPLQPWQASLAHHLHRARLHFAGSRRAPDCDWHEYIA